MLFKSVISEILQKEILLEEKDNRDKIMKVFGVNQKWADEFHSISPKQSIWVADTFINKMVSEAKVHNGILGKRLPPDIRDFNDVKKWVVNLMNSDSSFLGKWAIGYSQYYNAIFDWYRNVNTGSLNLKSYDFDQAKEASEEWHESLTSQKSENYIENNEIVIDYRDGNGIGYYWANLNSSYSKEESDRMGHCGNKTDTTLFSLRKIDNNGDGESFITLARQPDGVVSEIHGKKNSKPKASYRKYIIDFLLNNKYPIKGLTLKGVYKPENNFQLDDLTDAEIKHLFEKNKDIKFNHIFNDVVVYYHSVDDENICLAKKGNTYGLVDVDKVELIKPFKFKLDSDSDFTTSVKLSPDNPYAFNGKGVYVIKTYVNPSNDEEFFTLQNISGYQRKKYNPSETNQRVRIKIVPKDFVEKIIK